MTLEFVTTRRTEGGFTAALTYLSAREPFSKLPAGPLVASISGSIRRGHYILAIEDRRVVGVTCWAVTDYETARRWSDGDLVPDYAQTLDGDTVVLTLGGGNYPRVALRGVRHIAGLYPGRRYFMTRFGRAGTKRGRFPAART